MCAHAFLYGLWSWNIPPFEWRLACKSWLFSFFCSVFCCCCCCVYCDLAICQWSTFFKWENKEHKRHSFAGATQSLKLLDRHRHFYSQFLRKCCSYLAYSNFRLLLACLFLPSVFFRYFFLCNLLILWTFILAFCITITLFGTLKFSPLLTHTHCNGADITCCIFSTCTSENDTQLLQQQ